MNVNRRGFLRALFAGAPAVVLGAPEIARLLAAGAPDPPAGAAPTFWGCGHRPAGRHVLAAVEGPARVGSWGGNFDPGPQGVARGWPWELELVVPDGVLFDRTLIHPACSCRRCTGYDGVIVLPAGRRVELAARLREPGLVGGWIARAD